MAVVEQLTVNGERLWQQWLDWATGQGIRLPACEAFAQARARVWEASEFVALTCARVPETLAELLASGELDRSLAAGDLDRALAAAMAPLEAAEKADDERLKQVLRRFRRRQMVRIVWRDLAGAAPLEETLEDLSELADVCIRRPLALLERWAQAELGVPRDGQGEVQHLLVMGMGKLGARELNLSSDIDLIFAYPAAGEVEGPRQLSNEQFFARLARRLVQALDDRTVDGFVFRVDTRLRPFGDAGPLAMSFAAMEDYYQSQAREWERYAMIKASVVAGPEAAAGQLMSMLRPFTYRRYLDFGAIDSLRSMKQLISQELKRKGMADNIKLGPGGIREIEFIGQAFQLIRGGRDPDLQIRPIRSVLRRLGEKLLIPDFAVRQLDEAYVFLRLVENRIQAWKDKQTHLLPDNPVGRLRLARAMGYGDWPAFVAALDTHRRRVQGQFDSVFAEQTAEDPEQGSSLAALWHEELGGSQALALLAAAGFTDPDAALERLSAFRGSVSRKGLSTRGAQRLRQLMPLVLQVVAGADAPDSALERVLRVLESVVRRTAYLAMLAEHPIILSQLAQLAGMSPWISRQVARHPLLLDELLDPRRLYAPLRRADLRLELGVLLDPLATDDLEQQMERLRQFAQGNMLRVAAADLKEVIPLMVVSDYLTEIAEVTVDAVVGLAYRHLARRHGRPAGAAHDRSGFLVVGYGKLGGVELGYGSDLDLVFLHGSDSVNAMTDGDRPISNDQFYMRLGQRVIHMLTTQTPSGQLYEIDMRLRPDGNKGMLVRSLGSFAGYQADDAWTWEHQALVRARPVAGDRALYGRFSEIRRETLCRARDDERLRRDVREMREKMRANLDKTRGGRFDLKQGRGGIADIEFMVQYSVLRWAHQFPELSQWSDNIRLLETLERLELLPGSAAGDLTAAYKGLRAAYHRSALQDGPMTIAPDQLAASRERVAGLWRELMEE
jgi:glutamate-ammonia-ligase adenylyltransferase